MQLGILSVRPVEVVLDVLLLVRPRTASLLLVTLCCPCLRSHLDRPITPGLSNHTWAVQSHLDRPNHTWAVHESHLDRPITPGPLDGYRKVTIPSAPLDAKVLVFVDLRLVPLRHGGT